MKAYFLVGVLLMGSVLLLGMGKHPQDCQDCYKTGYQDAIEYVEHQSRQFRDNLKTGLANQLFWYAILIVGITLWGSEFSEWIRTKMQAWFNLTAQTQMKMALVIYGSIIAGILIGVLNTSGASERMMMPVLILLSASLIPFVRYVCGLSRNDTNERKINLTKIKQFIIMCLAILVLYQVLSESGFMGIKIGG